GRVIRSAYPDPTALNLESPYHEDTASSEANPWSAVDVEFVEAFSTPLALARLKANPALRELALVKKGSRLSVMPVSDTEWQAILAMR
ncbi:MAG TPA: EVE domain-containing protein, partial [Pseudomonas sp.]|nr:EVE domain-containing protein [Pseudomonas sp.]